MSIKKRESSAPAPTKKEFYSAKREWRVQLDCGNIYLTPLDELTDRISKPDKIQWVCKNVSTIQSTKGNSLVMSCELPFEDGTFAHAGFFVSGAKSCLENKGLIQLVKIVATTDITLKASKEVINDFFC